ncbi:TdiD protein [Ceratobasidium sp. AG-I]|nr:TdiD protein [Ceratobasidium sp. AG-I]
MVQPVATNVTAEDAPEITQLKASQSPKPNGSDYTRFLAHNTTLRSIDGIRGLLPLEQTPGIISLLAGKPNPSTFPIEEIAITVRNPGAPQPYSPSGGEAIRETITLKDSELAVALQYNFTDGIPALRALLADFQTKEHGVVVDDVYAQLSVGSGSQDLLYKAFTCLLDPGDSVLIEAPVYAGVLPIFQGLDTNMVEVESDPDGISIESLRDVLKNWPIGKRFPKALYTVPFGCNPSGATTTLERRKAVLEIAEEYDFLILEDDPYFFLYFGDAERPPSYFSMDHANNKETQLRVLRFDSFSKVFAGGMRIEFTTGPPQLMKAINAHTSAANLQPASTTQSLILSLLQHWGYSGFHQHIANISGFYHAKRDLFDAAMRKHFTPEGGKALAEWTKPDAGLFFWFKLILPEGEDSAHLIRTRALAKGVLAIPGTVFFPGGRKSSYVRASYSLLDESLVDDALGRLASVVREVVEQSK